MSESVENALLSFLELSITSSYCIFCPINSQKRKDSKAGVSNTKRELLLLYLKKVTETLICQNSWPSSFSFCQLIGCYDRLIIAVLIFMNNCSTAVES